MSKTTIKPLFNNVLIKPLEMETKTPSGIVLPDSAKEEPQMGEVMAVGPGSKEEPMAVKVGDKVLYKKWGGNDVKVDGAKWMILEQKDILAVSK